MNGDRNTFSGSEEQPMDDRGKSREQLIGELKALRERTIELEKLEFLWKEVERSLEGSDEKFRLLYSPTFNIVLNREGTIFNISNLSAKQLGFSRQEILGRNILEFLSPEHQERIQVELSRDFKGDYFPGIDVDLIAKDGSQHTVLFDPAEVILYDEEIPIRIHFSGIDITERKRIESTLREERNRAQKYLDTAGVMFVVINNDQKIIQINRKGCEILECNEENIIGKNWFDSFIPPRYGKEMKTSFHRLITGDAVPRDYFENPVIAMGGEEKIIAWYNTILRDNDGNVIGILASGEDISKRKKAELALRESEERYRNIFEHSVLGIYRTTPDGQIIIANPALVRMLGYSSYKKLGKLNLEDIGFELQESRSIFKENIERDGEVMGLETMWMRKDGTPIYVSENAKAFYDEDRNIIFYEGTVEDITRRKTSEKALYESELRFRELADLLPQTIFELDDKGNLVFVNRIAFDSFGYSEEDYEEGLNVFQMVVPEDRERIMDHLERVICGEKISGIEYTATRKDGVTFPILIYASPIIHGAELSGIRGIVVDVTEQKKAEEKIKHLNAVLRAIRNVNQIIVKETDRGKLLKGVCESFIETRGYYSAWIVTFNEKGEFQSTASAGLDESVLHLREQLELGDLPLCIIKARMRSDVVVIAEPRTRCGGCVLSGKHEVGAVMSIKLEHNRKAYGILTVSVPDDFITEEDEHVLFSEVADDISFALYSLEQEERRKRAEKDVQEQKEFLENILDSLTHPFYVINADDHTIEMANSASLIEDLSDNPTCYMVSHHRNEPCSGDEHICPLDEVKRTKEPVAYEHVHIDRNGEMSFVEVHGYPIFDREENVVQMIEYCIDVTDRKKAEEDLKQSEESFKTLVSNIPGVTYRCAFDKDWTMEFVSDEIGRLSGYPASDFIKNRVRSYASVIHPDDREHVENSVMNGVEHRNPYMIEYRMIHADGSIRWVYERGQGVFNRNDDLLWLDGAVFDITERKRMESKLKEYTEHLEREVTQRTNELVQVEKMAAIGQLVAGVAHEINNPLAYVKGNLELIVKKQGRLRELLEGRNMDLGIVDDIDKFMKPNIKGINRIAKITKTLKRFARRDVEGRTFADVNLGIKDTIVMVYNQIKEKVNLHEDYGARTKIPCNIGQLNQVFMNLLINAAEAIEKGDIWIKTWEEDKNIYIEFRDNGSGIPQDRINNIFEPFHTTKDDGTGLGLSISYRIIKDHNGEITVESDVGKGTTMRIRLPMEGR